MSSRRSFLGLLASGPFAAKEAISSAATSSAAAVAANGITEGAGLAGLSAAIPAPPAWGAGVLQNDNFLALYRAGIAPDWVVQQVEDSVASDAMRMDPDIAGLRSMSLSARMRLQKDRSRRKLIEFSLREMVNAHLRQAFFNNKRGGDNSWTG